MYDYSWTKHLVISNEFDVFPLQFVNTKRIEYNDSVFIFDEVGCGKTISSGLMALNYLYNTSEDVQIITINSLVRPIQNHTYGQFLNDWFEKLPFESLGMKDRIYICNNHFKRISEIKKVGLLIIDEAHLFLEDSKRAAELQKIKAEKVIFLTATPIKSFSRFDLNKYSEIANNIVGERKIDLQKELLCNYENPICSRFNMKSPVTRYFKDSVTALDYVDEIGQIQFEKKKAKRLIPQIWEFDNDNKVQVLMDEIRKRRGNASNPMNRFVIFTRFIEKESNYILEQMLKEEDFVQWAGHSVANRLTVVNLHGKSQERPTSFSHNGSKKDLPDIIIINYQIAEQGLNLPGYNYVINYHISSFPASLEQRFGRIDRMGKKNASQFEEINMAFLISKNGWETYKINFYNAVYIYRNHLITSIPAKNVILTENILKRYHDDQNIIGIYINEVEAKLESGLISTYNYLQNCAKKDKLRAEGFLDGGMIDDNEEIESGNVLIEFCIENEIYIEEDDTVADLRELIKSELRKHRQRLFMSLKNENLEDASLNTILEKIGDKIYLFDEEKELKTFDAIKDCAFNIYNSEEYKSYVQEFYEQVKLPKIIERYSDRLEEFFEEKFLEPGGFDEIIRESAEYGNLLKDIIMVEWTDISPMDRQALCANADIVVNALPIFTMIRSFRNIVSQYLFTQNGIARERYDFHLPISAVYKLNRLHAIPEAIMNSIIVADGFIGSDKLFYMKSDGNKYVASNWFKLFYFCGDCNANLFHKFVYTYQWLCERVEAERVKLWEQNCPVEKRTVNELLKEKYGKELDELYHIMSNIKKNKMNCVNFFEIFFAPEGGKKGKWRKPYWGWTQNWSNLLPVISYGNGYKQVWSMTNERETDFWTYMIFSEIGAYAIDDKRTITKDWWLNSFIPNRCECSENSNSILKDLVVPYINKVML